MTSISHPHLPADFTKLMHVRLLHAHHHLDLQIKHAENSLAAITDTLAIDAGLSLTCVTFSVYLIPWNRRSTNPALP